MRRISRDRPQLRSSDFGEVQSLKRPLNDAIDGVYSRLEGLEIAPTLHLFPVSLLQTGAAIAVGTAPFPMKLNPIGSPILGLLVVKIQNLTTAANSGVSTTAIQPWWESMPDGSISIRYITGLAVSSKYSITFAGLT